MLRYRLALIAVMVSSALLGAFGYRAYIFFFPAEPAYAAVTDYSQLTTAPAIYKDSIYRLSTQGQGEGCYRSGTAWAIADDANGTFLITNAHVVIGASDISVVDTLYRGQLLRVDIERDLALVYAANLRAPLLKANVVKLENDPNRVLTSWGFPSGATSLTSHSYDGVYSTSESYLNDVYTSYRGAPAIPGESGSPIFNTANEVVGTVYASSALNGVFFTPVADALKLLGDWNQSPTPQPGGSDCEVVDRVRGEK